MIRTILAAASLAGLFLFAGLGSGLLGGPPWTLHEDLGLAALLLSGGVHVATAEYLDAWVDWARARPDLPGWVGVQAGRNMAKGLPCQYGGLGLIGLTAWSGLAAWPDGWHRVVSTVAVGFQPVAFVGEVLIVLAQARLVREVDERFGPGSS